MCKWLIEDDKFGAMDIEASAILSYDHAMTCKGYNGRELRQITSLGQAASFSIMLEQQLSIKIQVKKQLYKNGIFNSVLCTLS